MKLTSVTVSAAISTAILIMAFAPAAQADNIKMSQFAGRYKVSSCKYLQNYTVKPKDYYCRVKEFSLIPNADGSSVELRLVDELNQDLSDVTMTEYRKDQKDGTLESGSFQNDETEARWNLNIQKPNTSLNETRSFRANSEGVHYYRTLSYSTNDVYKTAQWEIDLVPVK